MKNKMDKFDVAKTNNIIPYGHALNFTLLKCFQSYDSAKNYIEKITSKRSEAIYYYYILENSTSTLSIVGVKNPTDKAVRKIV